MPNRWCDSAELRRKQIDSGLDLTFNEVFKPFFNKAISELRPKRILEVGAGTGHLAKEISQLGCEITAIEPSNGMFRVAKDVLSDSEVNVKNCSSNDLPFTEKYDAVFSHLVAHVVDDILKFFSSIAIHLDIGGHLLFSIPHPCFYNDYKNFFGAEYSYMQAMMKTVSFYISLDKENEIYGVPYHHRPLSIYINSLNAAGFVLVKFEEIYPDEDIQAKYGSAWDTPRYCVFTCRKF